MKQRKIDQHSEELRNGVMRMYQEGKDINDITSITKLPKDKVYNWISMVNDEQVNTQISLDDTKKDSRLKILNMVKIASSYEEQEKILKKYKVSKLTFKRWCDRFNISDITLLDNNTIQKDDEKMNKNKKNIYGDEIRHKVINLYKEGKSYDEITKETGVSGSSIHRWTDRFRRDKPTTLSTSKLSKEQCDEIYNKYISIPSITQKQLAKEYNVSTTTIYTVVHSYDDIPKSVKDAKILSQRQNINKPNNDMPDVSDTKTETISLDNIDLLSPISEPDNTNALAINYNDHVTSHAISVNRNISDNKEVPEHIMDKEYYLTKELEMLKVENAKLKKIISILLD